MDCCKINEIELYLSQRYDLLRKSIRSVTYKHKNINTLFITIEHYQDGTLESLNIINTESDGSTRKLEILKRGFNGNEIRYWLNLCFKNVNTDKNLIFNNYTKINNYFEHNDFYEIKLIYSNFFRLVEYLDCYKLQHHLNLDNYESNFIYKILHQNSQIKNARKY